MRPALGLIALVVASALNAQPTLDLRPTCRDCRLTFEVVVEFQAEWTDGALPTRADGVQRFARSQWIVSDPDAKTVYRFDARGRYLGPLGRKGGGPGEFQGPNLMLPWGGDSVAVFDWLNARTSIYAPSGRYTRSQTWSGGDLYRAMLTPDGEFVVAGVLDSRASLGMPFHRFNRAGVRQPSFGAPSGTRIERERDALWYRTPARTEPDGSFWAVDARSPVLRRFTLGGLATTEWKLPMRDFMNLTSRPGPGLRGAEFMNIEPLEGGLLLVGLMVPDPRSAEAVGPPKTIDGIPVSPVEDWGRYTDTRFFVLDPRRRALVVEMTEDAFIGGSLGDGLYWGIRPGGDAGRLVVLRAVLTGVR